VTWELICLNLPTFHWEYSDPAGDPQAGYQIQIDGFTDSRDAYCPSGQTCAYTPSTTQWKDWIEWNTEYSWKVKVKDNQGNWSDWSDAQSFTTPLHAAPSPDFSPSKVRVSQKEVVTFNDNSLCYLSGDTAVPCQSLNVIYAWDFDYFESEGFTTDKTTKGNATWSYTVLGAHYVKLRIEDNTVWPNGETVACYSDVETVTVTLPLPRWWEIPPF